MLYSFLSANAEASGATTPNQPHIPGPLIQQLMSSFLGGTNMGGDRGMPAMAPFFGMFDPTAAGGGQGRWGDYVFTQDGKMLSKYMEHVTDNRRQLLTN